MALKLRSVLKNYFLTTFKPTQSQFEDLIDSNVNISEDKATVAEAQLGITDAKYLTPKGAKALVGTYVPEASETVKGVIEIATTAEIEDAEDKPLAVTPLGAKKSVEKFALVRKVNNISPVSGNVTITDITGTATSITGTITKSQVIGLESELMPKMMVMPVNPINLSDVTTIQDTLASVNLSAHKTYHFKGRLILTKGATSHSVALKWAASVESAIASMMYVTEAFSGGASGNVVSSSHRAQLSGIDQKTINAASASPATVVDFDGVVRANAATTLAPQIAFSAVTGSSVVLKVGSYMEFTELGNDTVEKVGSVN
jgi:hypothetical protein